MSVPTITLARVAIAWAQSPSRTIRTRQTVATIAGRLPDTYHAITAMTATTRIHGADVRRLSSGFRTTVVAPSLIAWVIPENVSVNHRRQVVDGAAERERDGVRELRGIDDGRGHQARRRASASGAAPT